METHAILFYILAKEPKMKTQPVYKSLLWISMLSALLMSFAPFAKDQAQPVLPGERQAKRDVYLLNIIVLNISDIDLSAGTYSVDMFISFICEDAPCANEPNWDVMNATEEIDPVDQGTSIPFVSYDYRLKTTLIGQVDYTFYPFDYLYIEMFIEDKQLGNDQITYRLDALSVDKVLFNPSGWFYDPAQNGSEVSPASYPLDPMKYDRIDIWMFLERDGFGAFMKTIFAALVIVLVGMLSFLLRVDDAKERLALTSSTLVAIVLYHISVVAGVPATGYLTFVDKFMIATYVIIFLSLVVSVLLLVYVDTDRKEAAEKLHKRSRWTIPALWLVLMAYVFIFQLIVPYNKLLAIGGGG
jgi:hypothetical protein